MCLQTRDFGVFLPNLFIEISLFSNRRCAGEEMGQDLLTELHYST